MMKTVALKNETSSEGSSLYFLEISNCSTLRFVELILEEVAQSQHRNTCSRSAMNNASLNRQIVTQSYRQSLAFACSKSTMKTPEQCVKFVQS